MTKLGLALSPEMREVQFDEKWTFVAKKEKNCDPTDPADNHKGDTWDHVAFDPESRLVVSGCAWGAPRPRMSWPWSSTSGCGTGWPGDEPDHDRRLPGLRGRYLGRLWGRR